MAEILRVWKQEGFQIKKRKKETVLSEKFTEVSEYISQHYQEDLSVAELAAELSGNPLTDGLTLSGGEPFCQAAECAALARIARERGLNVWAYTGYTYERLLAGEVPDALALLEQVDVLVDGPFVEAEKSYAALFRGSANQRLIDVPKSLAAGAVVLWERPDPLAHFTRPES